MVRDGNQPLNVRTERLRAPAPTEGDAKLLAGRGAPATHAVPRPTSVGSVPAACAAAPRVEPQHAVRKARSGADSAVAPGRNAGGSAQPQRRGPKTAAGKARVGLNALTHGISSTRLVVPGESTTEWATYRQAIVDDLVPTGPVELALAERVAIALWRLQRVAAYEEAAIAERQELETASARLLPHPLDLDKIVRYEAHLSRQLYQALHELESRRAERRGQPTPLLRVDVQHQAGTREVVDGSSM